MLYVQRKTNTDNRNQSIKSAMQANGKETEGQILLLCACHAMSLRLATDIQKA